MTPLINTVLQLTQGRIIQSDQFTFLVGEDKTPVVVHSNALAATSAQIDRLINGQMKEAGSKCAELPDLSVDDFTRFCEYAYRGDYTTPAYAVDEILAARRKSEETSPAEGSQERPEQAAMNTIPGSPPPEPLPTPPPVDDWSAFTTKKSKTPKPSKKSIFRKDYRSRIYLPRKEYEAKTTDQFKPQPNTMEEQDFAPVFLAHARLYAFAHMRMVDYLGALTLDKLHDTLTNFQLFENRVSDVLELARYAYSNEYIPSRDRDGKIDKLKDLVVNYIASEFDIIGRTPVFITLLEEGGEFVSDFCGILLERLL